MNDLHRIIWLASYPKSGNTWMRSLLAHYFMPKGQAPDINSLRNFTTGDNRVDFYDRAAGGQYTGETVRDWLRVRHSALKMIAGSKDGHHFVKTHCPPIFYEDHELIPSNVTAAAIYIMRNPFDVVLSFARHTGEDLDTTVQRMQSDQNVMASPRAMFDILGRWDRHVDAWTDVNGLAVHIIRYEDLLAKPGPTVRKLLEKFLKVKVDTPKLTYAIKATSFESLKKQEEEHGFRERPEGMKSFFAKGKAGGWKEELTPEQVGTLREAFLPTLEKWYPEMLKETAEFAEGKTTR